MYSFFSCGIGAIRCAVFFCVVESETMQCVAYVTIYSEQSGTHKYREDKEEYKEYFEYNEHFLLLF